MKKTFIKESFLTIFATLFCLAASFGQTSITTGAVTPSSVCAGSDVSVAFTFAGTPAANTDFIAQLSDATGAFGLTPTEIGSAKTSPITATIPAGTAAGAAYKIRVISRILLVVQVTGSESAALTVNAVPAAPAVVTPVNYEKGASAVALTATPATGLLWYTDATTGTGSATAPVPSTAAEGTTSYWVSQKVGTCESPRAKIDVIVTCTAPPKPTVTSPVTYTVGDAAAVLIATPSSGGTINWYGTNATGGTASPTAPKPSTAAAGTTTYYVSQTVGTCESERAQIVVNVSACTPPAKPTVTSPVTYTVGDAAAFLVATPSSGGTINWYGTNATGGTASPTAPKPSTAAAGTTTYYVSQTVGTCESERAQIVVNVSACTPPAKPTVTSPVTYTVGDAAAFLVATPSSGGTINWYGTNATGGTASSTAPKPSTAAAGTTTYYVSQTVGACESERAKIDVIVTNCILSDAPTVTSPTSYCASTTPVAALVATGTSIKWYNAVGTALGSAPIPNVNVGTTTEYKYYVTQTQNGKCESAKKEVIITVFKTLPPAVSSDVLEYCLNAPATALQATGSNLKWYASSTGTTEVSPIPNTATAGNLTFYVSQTQNNCVSDRARIDVKIKPLPAKPTVAAIAPVCLNTEVASSVLLNAVAPKTGLLWYSDATGGTGSPTTPTPDTKTAGTKNFYVAQTSNGCESDRAVVSILVKALPEAPKVTSLVEYCKDFKNATVLTATGDALKWYNSAGPLPQAPKPATTTVGTVSYFVTQTLSACESPKAEIKVTINPLPAAATVVTPEAICQEKVDKAFPFSATGAPGNTFNWYSQQTEGTKEPAVPSVNLKNAGETIFYVTQVDNKGCESATRVAKKIRVKRRPGQPNVVTAPIEYCQFIPAKELTATPEIGASLNWYGTNATGGAPGAAPTPSTQDGGTTSYYVSQSLEGCEGDRAKIDVKVNTTPKPTTKTYLEYCQNATAPVLDATGTILKWYREANGTDWQGVPFVPFTEKVQDYSFYVTQTGSNGCESPKEEIKIHIKSLPSATISGNSTIDLGQSATIRIKFTGDGPWKYILSNGDTATTNQVDHQVTVKPSTTTSYLITEVSNACGKGIPIGSALVTVKVPTINSGNPSVSEVCAGKPFTVPFQQSGDFPAGNTFKLQVATQNADAKFYTIPSTATSNSITATFPDTTKGGTFFVRVISSGTNPDFTVKGSVSSITINATPLPVATLTGTQTILVGETADLKADITGKGPWTITLNNGTKDTLITANATPFTIKLAPKTTTTYAITKVTNGCGIGTGVGTARVQVDPILGVEPPAPADWAKVYPTVINGKCTVEVTGTISPKQAKIEVVDLNGRPRSTHAIQQQKTEVDFGSYPSGLYLLRIQNGNLTTVQRVMKP